MSGATIFGMGDDENIGGGSGNGAGPENGSDPSAGEAGPYMGLSDAERKAQQEQLSELLDELIAEGAKPGRYLPQLEADAATWPE